MTYPVEVSIIIVNYHSADYVQKCVDSICEQAPDPRYEIIVVDNASYDGCRERLNDSHPEVIWVQSERNIGFARANNLGTYHSHGSVLLFLNPDTEVRERAIERLYQATTHSPDAGVVGCRLLNTDGSLQISCIQAYPTVLNQLFEANLLQRLAPRSDLWGITALLQVNDEPTEIQVVSGACMMIRREVFERIGGFSTDYFMYGEDLDICLKSSKAGFRNYYLGNAVVVHHGGGSSRITRSDFSHIMIRESVRRFLRKYRGPSYSNCYRFAMLWSAIVRLTLLGFALPVRISRDGRDRVGATCRKWLAILRWGLGLTKWTQRYYSADSSLSGKMGK